MVCKRCGQCCMKVGSTFWTHGDFEKWPDLKKQAETVELGGDDGMPCQMLLITQGKATCWIHNSLGYVAKPEVCRDYPEEGLCWFEQEMEGDADGQSDGS